MGESLPLLQKIEVPQRVPQAFLSTLLPLTQFIATFAFAKDRKPQCIAHRGYKAAQPENTMGAFKAAVEVGAHAIETDIHLSKDGVVVLSHVSNVEISLAG